MTGDQEPWEALVEAEGTYLARRAALYEAGTEDQLRRAMQTPRGRGTALRVLRDAPVEVVMSLVEPVFDAAATTHGHVGLARDVLGRLDPGWLSRALAPLVDDALDGENADWETYRRTAEVLDLLGQEALLMSLVERARSSEDPDVLEVAEDYQRP